MRILFLCNTVYQIIAASCIREMFPESKADIILSDHSTDHKKIYESFKRNNLIFDSVYYVETKYLYEYDKTLDKDKYRKTIRSDEDFLQLIDLQDRYDAFFCANSEPFSGRIVNYLKRSNSKVEINWFEDGITAYNFDKIYFGGFKKKLAALIRKFFYHIFDATSSVQNYYVFLPEKMEWKPDACVKKIAPLSKRLLDVLSLIFEYKECSDRYEEKYIFFEDGMKDWDNDSDVLLVKMISDIVGKENIIVKIHPRNPVNRFKELGYKTNIDMSVPWEIIAANICIEDKILITMYSQSVVTPEILFGRNGKVVVLGLLNNNMSEHESNHFQNINRQFFSEKPDTYFIPKSKEELVKFMVELSNNLE